MSASYLSSLRPSPEQLERFKAFIDKHSDAGAGDAALRGPVRPQSCSHSCSKRDLACPDLMFWVMSCLIINLSGVIPLHVLIA